MKNDNNPIDLSPLVGNNATKPAAPTEDRTGGRASSRAVPGQPPLTPPLEGEAAPSRPLSSPPKPELEGERPREPRPANPRRLFRPLAYAALLLALLSAAAGAWLSAHHIIQTDDGTAVIRKRYLTFDNTKVDIRQWDHQAFQANAEVTKAMTAQGYGDLVKQPPVVVETRKGMLGKIKDWGPVLSDKTQQAGTTLGRGLRKAGSATASGIKTAGRATGDHAQYVVSYWGEKLL